MTIPRKTSLTGAIPRRNSGTSSALGSGGRSSLHGSIPRKNSSSHSNVNSYGHNRNANGRAEDREHPKRRPSGQLKRLSFKIPPQRRDDPARAHPKPSLPSQDSQHKGSSRSSEQLGRNILSERPFRIAIDLRGVDLTNGGIPRAPERPVIHAPPKRERKQTQTIEYKEFDDTSSEGDLSDSDDDDYGNRKKKKKIISKKVKSKKPSSSSSSSVPVSSTANYTAASVAAITASGVSAYQQTPYLGPSVANVGALPATAWLELGNNSFESPPTGSLSSLWYSREIFVNTYVVEKILAWRTRPVAKLEWDPDSYTDETKPVLPPVLDSAVAAKYSEMARSCPLIWRDPKKRNEVSRIAQEHCPIVMAMAVEAQHQPGGGTTETGASAPKYRIKATPTTGEIEREEVYLIKWRGKSYLHASWERGSDIIRTDSTNNTARSKIRKYIQAQELAFGTLWKKALEDERKSSTTANVLVPASTAQTEDVPKAEKAPEGDEDADEEEHYPPANTEIERILGCDESEMDLSLYAKQRALNILDDQDLMKQKEKGGIKVWNSKEGLKELLTEAPWDPEDNVRYVVKWNGLPFADMTWEYWKDIKTDAADEAEDFWIRQQPPDEEILTKNSQPHPHMKDFRKIQESPSFGISQRKRLVADSVDGKVVPKEEEDESEGFRLRNYQLEGVNWLLFNWWNHRSCILADEMGLGKTIQSVGFIKLLQDLPNTGVRGPFLIVAPLSLIGQWQSEMKSWAPDLNIVLYHGSADARDFLVKNDFFFTDQFVPKATATKLRKQHVTKFHLLITTYEVVLKDVDVFTKIKWKALIVDEAHRLKNSSSKLFEELTSVPRDYCLLLTGTPLANATEELWALLKFANGSVFDSKEDFLEKFGQLTDSGQVDQLHAVLKPYLLRRVKEDVEKSMPPKTETILEVTLTPSQKKFYKAIYERNTTFLFKGAKPKNQPSLMNVMMELRKCCNHPFLIRGAEEKLLLEATQQIRANDAGAELNHVKIFHDQLVKSSGKMVLIHKLLPKLYANGHKVLIFSQMVRVLDLLEELLKMMRYKYERLDGSTRSSSRAAAVERFIRKSCQRFVMLLSTRAGGLGLNLTAADIVIIFDSDWNPQNDLQAMARAHRIGQTKAVRVYRLLTAKTYEMHMFHSASMKLGLEQAVLSQQRDQGEGGDGKKSKSKSEREAQAKKIDQLLKKGAYDVFRDDDDEEAKKFMETDIDQLMESSAKDVTYGKQQSNLSSGLGSFSKASFVTDTGDGEKDVDLDDPDFWSKAVGLDKPTDMPEEISHMIDDGVKRSRKQVEQFDPYADVREEERIKQEKIDIKIQAEKDERERLREEKRAKKLEKSKKRKSREEKEADALRNKEARTLPPPPNSLKKRKKLKTDKATVEAGDAKKTKSLLKKSGNKKVLPLTKKEVPQASQPSQKKSKRTLERKRALRKAENENPMIENLKQGWEISHRNRAVAACIRFGFSRVTKIRHESNLQCLPIQDIEVFFRQFVYQQSLQLAVVFMQKMHDDPDCLIDNQLRSNLQEYLGQSSSGELQWLSDCLTRGIKDFLEVENQRRSLRLPFILAEESYIKDLRRGAALRSLRRIYMACRIERVVGNCVDGIISELGYEQLAQRGCQTSNISSLDIDMKTRLVSTEELTLSINLLFARVKHKPPANWWDRSCDIALLLGTFVHGLGNYEAMLQDETLPFAYKIRKYAKSDSLCCDAQKRFANAASAAKQVCDDALEQSKLKAQKEVQKAVAAAAAASLKREKEAAALREGGDAANAVMSNMGEQPLDHLYEMQEGKDDHFITLPRVKESIETSIRSSPLSGSSEGKVNGTNNDSGQKESKGTEENKGRRKRNQFQTLPMPDARVLDFRLKLLLFEIERRYSEKGKSELFMDDFATPKFWSRSDIVSTNQRMRDLSVRFLLGPTSKESSDQVIEYAGVGLNGTQCGVTHRTVDDRADYSIGAASPDLYQVAHGPESPRYLRALGVPMTFGRFGLVALVHADEKSLHNMLANEHDLFYNSKTDHPTSKSSKEKIVPDNTVSMSKNPELPGEKKGLKEEQSTGEKNEVVTEGVAVSNNTLTAPFALSKSVPIAFQDSAVLRAGVSCVLLHFGFPLNNEELAMANDIWSSVRETSPIELTKNPSPLFGRTRFLSLLKDFCGDIEIPEMKVIEEYIEGCFLPHCLKLCLYGNNSATQITRGSKGEYKTFDGTCCYPEPTETLQSPLPDPCLPLSEQSIEAVGMASAIIRRVRLMRCILTIATGKVEGEKLQAILHSKTMRKSMDGLPAWWCPWIHDTALLVHASTQGLFSIVRDRELELGESHAGHIFSQEAIKRHVKSIFFYPQDNEEIVPQSILDSSSIDDADAWVERYANEFPSLNTIERRLAFLCAMATEEFNDGSRFDNLPMYDHGGWPRL